VPSETEGMHEWARAVSPWATTPIIYEEWKK